jgi:uncharacterized protein (TIGR03437 family)
MSRKLICTTTLLVLVSLARPSVTKSSQLPGNQPQVRHQEVSLDLVSQVETKDNIEQTSRGSQITARARTATLITQEIAVPLDNPAPFLAVAPLLSFLGADEQVELSFRSAATAWSEWAKIEIDRDAAPRGSGKLSALLLLEKETTKVQFRIQLEKGDTTSPLITELKVNFISPGETSPAKLNQLTQNGLPTNPESSTAKYPKPLVTSRTDWGCPDGQGNPRGTPSYTTVTHLIVHHTATSNTATDWPAVVRSIWNFHIFTNGWSDIGYNYLIDPNGVIYEGRAGGDNVLGAHFSCQNSGTMGVSLLGTFTSVRPTDAALTSVKELLSWKADQRDIDPTASSFHNGMQQSLTNISGHRDGNGLARSCTATECPGDMFYPLLPGLRNEVKSFVSPADDFSLTSTVGKQLVAKGSSITFPVSSATTNGTSQTISLSLRNLPAGLSHNFNSSSIVTGNTAQLTINVPETFSAGTYPLTVIGNGSTKRALELTLTITGAVASVSAASYAKAAPVASESIVAAFGGNLAAETKAAEKLPLPTTLSDVTVKVKDSAGNEGAAPLFFVSPQQINYQLPPGLARGIATVTVINKTEVMALGSLNINAIAPGIFAANANGQGAAVGLLQRRKADGTDAFEPIERYDEAQKLFFSRPLDLSNPNEQYFLTLFGTGLRFRNPAAPVTAQIGGLEVEVLYAGEQREYVGLDQVNLRLTPTLIGKGQVTVLLNLEGQTTNPVTVVFK